MRTTGRLKNKNIINKKNHSDEFRRFILYILIKKHLVLDNDIKFGILKGKKFPRKVKMASPLPAQ